MYKGWSGVFHCLIADFQAGQWRFIHQNLTCAGWQVSAGEKEQLPLLRLGWVGMQLCPLGLEYDNTYISNVALESK